MTPSWPSTFLNRAVEALDKLRALKPMDTTLSMQLRDVAASWNILKGLYSSAESFRDSVRGHRCQKELHDGPAGANRPAARGDHCQARAAHEADPKDRKTLMDLAELLCRREDEKTRRKRP
jgi:hypothetical protein